MFVNAFLCWRLIEMPIANFASLSASSLSLYQPYWVDTNQGTHKQSDHVSGTENKHFSSDHMGTHLCVIAPRKDFSLGTFFLMEWIYPYLKFPIPTSYGIHADYQMCYQ